MKHRWNRSHFAGLILFALMLSLMAGCGGGQTGSTQQPAPPAVSETQKASPVQSPDHETKATETSEPNTKEEDEGSDAAKPAESPSETNAPAPGNAASPAPETTQPAVSTSPDPQPEPTVPENIQPESPSPSEPAAEEPSSATLEDGSYTAAVTLEGGTGRASVQSPAKLRCENGQVWATIVWSSSNYDYMKVDGVRYELLSTEGNSTFEIPVAAFDQKLNVIADTVAMSTPHEVEYTLTFDSASLVKE